MVFRKSERERILIELKGFHISRQIYDEIIKTHYSPENNSMNVK
jgi:hypothetical protein